MHVLFLFLLLLVGGPSALAATLPDFRGRITAVLDYQTLAVSRSDGSSVRVRLQPGVSWPITREDLSAAALNREVTISTATPQPDGTLLAFVLLPNNLPLIHILETATAHTPAAREYQRQRVLEQGRARVEAQRQEKEGSKKEAVEIRQEAQEKKPLASDSAGNESERGGFTPQQWEELCKSYGQSAYVIAQARDRGVPLSAVIEFVRKSNAGAHPAVAKVFNDWYKGTGIYVYDNRWLRPQAAQQEAEVTCLKATLKLSQ